MAEAKELKCYLHPYQISFLPQQLRREVRLMNPNKFDLHFSVKSTAPEFYIVAPPNGVLHADKSIDIAITFVELPKPPNPVDRFRVDIRSADGTQTGVGYVKVKHTTSSTLPGTPPGSPAVAPSLTSSLNLGDLIPAQIPPPPAHPPPPPPAADPNRPPAPEPPAPPSPSPSSDPITPPPPVADTSRLRWIAVGLILAMWSLAHAYFRFPLLLRLVLSGVVVVLISLVFRISKPRTPTPIKLKSQ